MVVPGGSVWPPIEMEPSGFFVTAVPAASL